MLGLLFLLLLFSRFLWDPWAQSLACAGLVLAAGWETARGLFLRRTVLRAGFSPWLVGFLALFAVSAWASPAREDARSQAAALAAAFSLYALTRGLGDRARAAAAKAFCGLAAGFALLYLAADVVRVHVFDDPRYSTEAKELFLNVNVAASFFMAAMAAAMHLAASARAYALSCFLPLAAAFACTGSAAGAAGLVLGGVASRPGCLLGAWRKLPAAGKLFAALAVFALAWIAVRGPYLPGSGSIRDRARWWGQAAAVARAHPWTGAGPGSFAKLADASPQGGIRSAYAHNAYLQMAAEWGVPAALCFCAFLLRSVASVRAPFLRWGLAALLCHSLLDFALNVPGILLLFFFLLALPEEFPPAQIALPPLPARAAGAAGAAAALAVAWQLGFRPLSAAREAWRARSAFDRMDFASAATHLRAAIGKDPLPARYYAHLARALALSALGDAERKGDLEEAIAAQSQALLRDPLAGEYSRQMDELRALRSAGQ